MDALDYQVINKINSTSITDNSGRSGEIWYEEPYYLIEDISNLTLEKECNED